MRVPSCTLGALLLLPVAAVRGGLGPLLRAWRVVLLYTPVPNARGRRRGGVTGNPAVAVALGVAVLGEPLTLGTALGFLLIVLGLWLGAYGKRSSATVENAVPSAGTTLTDTVAAPPRRGTRNQSVAGTITE